MAKKAAAEPEAPPTVATPVIPEATAPPVEPVNPGYEWLSTAPVDEIMKHPRFGGILGQRQAEERERIRKEIDGENNQKALAAAEKELEELAVMNPDEFARRYLSKKEQERLADQSQKVREGVRNEFATRIGEAVRSLPEWQDLTRDELIRLQEAVAGKSDDQAIAAFNLTALDIAADRRSHKRHEDWRAKDLAKEREAIRAEEAAKALAKSERPDLARGSQPAPFNPTKLSGKEFDDWYRKTALGRI